MINQLVPQETEANRMIRNAIASLQSGAGTGAIEDAFRQLQFMEQQRQFNQNLTLQKTQQESQSALSSAQSTYYNALAQGKISASSATSNLDALWKQFGLG